MSIITTVSFYSPTLILLAVLAGIYLRLGIFKKSQHLSSEASQSKSVYSAWECGK